MPRRCPEDGTNDANETEDDGGDDTFVTAAGIPFPCALSSSGEFVPSPSPLNVPSSSLSDSVKRSSSNEHTTGTGSGSGPVSASASSIASGSLQQQQAQQQPPPPRGRFQSEADGASSRRWRPRPNSYDEFGAKPQRRSRFESMANLGVASGTNASASDLMARNATEGSLSRQTLVVREEGKSPTHFVSFLCLFFRGIGGWVKDFYLITWFIAIRQLHRPRTVRICVSCPELKHGSDGCCEADWAGGIEGGRDRAAHARGRFGQAAVAPEYRQVRGNGPG